MTQTPTDMARDAAPFEESAAAVLGELQAALAALVGALPGKATRAVDVQRALDLDKKLGWQLFTFVSAELPLREITSVPGAPSMRRVLAAATKRRVPRALADRVERAFEAFEAFVEAHGGDRDELVSLAQALSTETDAAHELRVRKSVYRGLAHVWGVRAETMVRTAIVHPGRDGTDDVLVVVGYVGLRRLRRDVPFALSATVGVKSHPARTDEPGGTRPESGPRISAMEVLEEYSSRPVPRMVARTEASGDIETELLFPPSTRTGAVTLFTAQAIDAAWSSQQTQHALNSIVKVPTERYVCELLVPTGWTDAGTARVGVYGRRGAVERVDESRPMDLLPQRETVTCTRATRTPRAVPGVPGHSDAVANVLARQGWLDVAYDVYRSVVEYPVLHTMIRIAADAARD